MEKTDNNPPIIRRVNDENRTDVNQPITEPVKEGTSGEGNPTAQPAPPAEPTPQGTNG